MQLPGPLRDVGAWCESVASKCVPTLSKDADESSTTPATPADDEKPHDWLKVPAWCEKLAVKAQGTQFFGGNPVDNVLAHNRERRSVGKRQRDGHGAKYATRELDLDLAPLSSGYKLIEGQGLGILRLAIHHESRQRRAILTIPKKNVPANVSKEDVEKQLELLLKIDHPNVLTLHEACSDARNIHLVYDWPEGGMLLDLLVRYHSDVTEGHIAGIFREVLAGLAAANHFNVHHLDWSLLVLFLGYKDRFSPLKLFGVGLAGTLINLVTTRKVSAANKHFYASPELLTENVKTMAHHKLHQCDIWSLGTLLYMICSGRPPFYGRREEVIEKIKKGKWIFGYEFDVISRESKDLIEQMLTRNVKLRPDANQLLKHPWLQHSSHRHEKKRGEEGGGLQDALKKLEDFAKETHCKQTLARLLADLGLQESQYADLEERFRQLDLDGNGVIEVTELAQVAATLPNIDVEMVTQIIATCDRNGNQTVDISEFVAAIVLKLEQKDERLLVKAFEKMDMNNDARITKGELFRILRQYSGSLEPSEISAFVGHMDEDKDNKIDYNEFKNLFPHMQAKNEEVQQRFQTLKTDVQQKKKHFHGIQSEVDKFCKKLKNLCGRFCQDFAAMSKLGNNEKDVLDRVRELHDTIKEFAGKEPPGAQQRALIAEAEEGAVVDRGRAPSMTGLAVINFHKSGKDIAGATKDEVELANESGASGSESEKADAAAGATAKQAQGGAPGATAAGTATAASAEEHHHGDHKTVADAYLLKAMHHKGRHAKQLKKDVARRRRFLWIGGGDGAKNFVNVFGPAKGQDDTAGKRKNRQSAMGGGMSARGGGGTSARRESGVSARQSVAQSAEGDDEDDDDMGDDDFEGSESEEDDGDSRSGRDEDKKKEEQKDDEENSDEDEAADALVVPWTTNKAKLRRTKEAIKLAGTPVVHKIGFLTHEQQVSELRRVQRELFKVYDLPPKVSEDLADLTKLMRFKCIKSWMPSLVLWIHQLEHGFDEQKINLFERRTVHLHAMRFCVQLCEKIMFSLAEFCLWQQEGFQAMFSVEEMCLQPPATKRFLPFRDGEVDELARTPRDGNDAEILAPDDECSAREMAPKGSARVSSVASNDSGSFAEDLKNSSIGEDMRSSKQGSMRGSQLEQRSNSRRSGSMGDHAEGEADTDGLANQVRFVHNRLDRNVVRAKHVQKDVNLNAKLTTQARSAYQMAKLAADR